MQTLEANPYPLQTPTARGFARVSPRELASLAMQALIDEAELTPKPGLVDRRGSGAHHDLSLDLMLLSAHVLRPFFQAMAQVAEQSALGYSLRERLGSIGRDAEAAMLTTTGGINTHRGAIWTIGLLVAAAAHAGGTAASEVCPIAGQLAAMADRHAPHTASHGTAMLLRFGANGARGEALAGFPHVRSIGLPALHTARLRGLRENDARLDALLAIMATLTDTCLLHRGGVAALEAAQQGAQRARDLGGCTTPAGKQALESLDAALLRHWASPGGAADLLAATLFLDALADHREGARA